MTPKGTPRGLDRAKGDALELLCMPWDVSRGILREWSFWRFRIQWMETDTALRERWARGKRGPNYDTAPRL
jgi:hypothetical protein